MIERKEYFAKLKKLQNKKIIKVVTGIRRCGKSTLLKMFREHLIKTGIPEKQLITINFEDIDYEEYTDYKKLYRYISEKMQPDVMNYIFLDEVQTVHEFQKAIDSLFIKENVDIYVTGSNAYMLSGEIATLLSGRYIEIKMLPLSLKEYKELREESQMKEITSDTNLYKDYVTYGSFPYVVALNQDKELTRDYIMGIYSTVLLKDIMQRKKIMDSLMLESVVKFAFDNIGNILSIKKISDTMTSAGRKISTPTVESYLSSLLESYVLYKIGRYDIKGKQYLKTQEKYYAADMGLRYFLLGSKTGDEGHILENIIYLELLRRGYEIFIGKVDEFEVDFITKRQGEYAYYQVALTVRDEQTLQRELRPLELIQDHFPKYLITLDDDHEIYHNGIKQINAIDFLMKSYLIDIPS